VSGGGALHRYFFSAGYDGNRQGIANGAYSRITLNARNTYLSRNNKLELASNIMFTSANGKRWFDGVNSIGPYTRLADEEGNPLSVAFGNATSTLRPAYTDTAGGGRLLDWSYRPVEELANGYR